MKSTKRIFVAIRPSEGAETEILNTVKKLRVGSDRREMDIKWSKPESWHITLAFLGEKTEEEIARIDRDLATVAKTHQSFSAKIEGLGAFPEVQQARVVWAGVQRKQALLDLQSSVEKQLGLPSDLEYWPHLTLGRLRNPGSVRDLISPFIRKKFGEVKVAKMILFESVMQGAKPVYLPIEEYCLAASHGAVSY